MSLNRSPFFLIEGIAAAAILLCLLLGLSQPKPREQSEAVEPEELQEVKIIAVEEEKPKPAAKKVERNEAPKTQQAKTEEQEIAPSSAKNLVAKAKNDEEPKSAPKRESAKKQATSKRRPVVIKNERLPSETYQFGKQIIEKGLTLINDQNGAVPIVEASYQQIGFQTYLRKMLDMGGQVFIGDPEKRQILARVVLKSQSKKATLRYVGLDTQMRGKLDGMALFRPREITNEPLVREILKHSFEIFRQEEDLRVVILLPLPTEGGILGALTEYLSKQGFIISDLDWVWGRYVENAHALSLRLEKGRIRKTRQIVQLNMTLEIN